jgi:hypothetical protein
MNKMIVLITAFLIGHSFAQNLEIKDVPREVKEKFAANYTNIKKVMWSKDNLNYEASFKSGSDDKSVTFDATGGIIEIETKISIRKLPVEIINNVRKNYPGFKITETARIEGKGMVTYEAEVTKGKVKMDLYFDEHGALKSKTIVKGKKNE